jgi:hypothetical protein
MGNPRSDLDQCRAAPHWIAFDGDGSGQFACLLILLHRICYHYNDLEVVGDLESQVTMYQ